MNRYRLPSQVSTAWLFGHLWIFLLRDGYHRGRCGRYLNDLCGYINNMQINGPAVESLSEKGANTMADVHVYFNRPADKEGAPPEDLKKALKKLEPVSDIDIQSAGKVGDVSI